MPEALNPGNHMFFKKRVMNLEPGAPVLREALLAIDRSSLGRLERYFALFTAV
jgi:hypothetical protein